MFFITLLIVLVIFLALGAWVARIALTKECPECRAEGTLFPIVPGYMAWCMNCSQTYPQSDLAAVGADKHHELGAHDPALSADYYPKQTQDSSEEAWPKEAEPPAALPEPSSSDQPPPSLPPQF